ncbi:MAG: methyltransferase [Bacteroidaceae bacterium]|nr:methyltransferase [Bacteroidaceae bacterium]
METQEFKIIAKTFQGLEEVLAKELTTLGANNIEIGRRMVAFTGDKEMLYKANFCLRTAVKVLKPILNFTANDADEIYEVVKNTDWTQYMDVTNTFLVDAVVFSENFRHSKFAAYRVKDGIADFFREKTGERPNVSITNPDIRINIHIAENDVTISLDSSGESLHQRGYRTGSVPAPLNEVLAAGIIMLTGWDGECDLIDPMCGSGTILIEAALIAMNIYPGVFRKEFAFEKWKDFDEELFDRIYNDDSQERDFDYKIYGYDINRQAVAIATENVRSAGVNKVVEVMQRDFYEFEEPRQKSIMITNPPYGERITTDDILGLYSTIGERLKHAFVGNDAWIFSYKEECFAKIGMRPSTRYTLPNGGLECELRKYQIFDGKLSDRREEGLEIKTADELEHNRNFKPYRRKNEDEDEEDYTFGKRGSRDDDHYFKSRPFAERKPFGKGKERNERKSFRAEDEDYSRNSKTYSDKKRKSFDGDKRKRDGERKFRGDREFKDKRDFKGRKDRDRKDFRAGGKEKQSASWGFDSEGRPFKRNDKIN